MIILLASLLYVLLTYLIESWISPGCSYEFNVVYMQRERSHSICYTTTTYEVCTYKNKNKGTSLRDIFVYHFFSFISVYSQLQIVIIETRSYDIVSTWWERNELINQSKYIIESSWKQPLVSYNKNCSSKFHNIQKEIPVLKFLFNKKL